MILLESSNKILEEALRERLFGDQAEKVLITAADFDGVLYKLSTPETKTQLVLSMSMPCFSELVIYGAHSILQREYGPYLINPENGYDVSLRIDLQALPAAQEERDALVRKFAHLKRNALAAPFERAFQAQMDGKETEMMTVHYREQEAIYVRAQFDRVTVIFSTIFKEETDQIFGKVFLQEFVDARRQSSLQNAPQVLFRTRDPPLELTGVPGLLDSDSVGYVTFVLFPRHFTGAAREECISRIQLFRDYLHYHIKCSKAYMHSRMRARVDSFLKVLNRAKPEKPDEQKEKKTASGKTFKRS
ncbi:hypothetical protein HK102_000901 [Quaeritorhiza haematococci]|nr:hypothetical protein HK102_000901 [Quaeritorhiza haematococci]